MTLRQALIGLNLRINHPEILAGLIIENYEYQCIISMLRYFKTEKFHDDMSEAVLDIQDGIDHGYDNFVLTFEDVGGDLSLKVKCLDVYEDVIDTYQ